jgi:predicted secreted Zn-dependent protease
MALRISWLLAAAFLALGCVPGAGQQAAGPGRPPAPDVVLLSEETRGGRVVLVESVTRRSYSVEGATAQELRAALDALGPLAGRAGASGGAGRYDGLTDWSLRWSYRYQRAGGSCSLASATVTLDIVVSLPVPRGAGLPPQLADRWQAYAMALESHEAGHVERERTLAAMFVTDLEETPAGPDCAELGGRLNALGESYIERIRLSDASYDAETNHGVSQGASFP